MIHELKCLPEYFNAVLSGKKTFEVRKNDRPFVEGDMLAMNEYDAETKGYTGRSCLVHIDYILDSADYCKDGYVVMSIKPCFVEKSVSPRNPISGKYDYGVWLATDADNNNEE